MRWNRTADDPPAGSGFLDTSRDGNLPRNRRLQVLGPKGFKVEKTGKGVRVTITDRDHENIETAGTSALQYQVHWAETVDMTTEDGISAGFKQSVLLAPPIPAPGRADATASGEFTDPKYATGYYFVTGVDASGRRSESGVPARITDGSGGTIPPDVTHFQVSESGEVHNGNVLSAVAYSFQLPERLNGLDRVQFWYENYPNLNELSGGESIQRTSGAGGSQTGVLRLPVARRTGAGTIGILGTAVGGTGTNFRAIAAAGDYLEIFGVRALIQSVDSPTTMTLAGAWSGPSVAARSDWQVIGATTIYAVSIGLNGERRDDVTGAPSQTVLLDGELSAPNAPTLAAQVIGNIVRLEVTPSYGTEIARVILYRGTGSGVAFASTSVIHTWHSDKVNSTGTLQFDDSDFTVYQREQGQVFSYYAQTVNIRDQKSSESSRVQATCRLDSGGDNSPPNTARDLSRNLLWNGMLWCNADTTIDVTDVDQDTKMGGGVPPAGHYRWDHEESGGSTPAGFQNSTEIILPAPGAAKYAAAKQRIDAWDNANSRIPKGAYLTFQVKARTTGGDLNGWLYVDISQQNAAGVHQGYAYVRERLSDDTIDESGVDNETFIIDPAEFENSYRLYWCVFKLRDTLTTDRIVLRMYYQSGTMNNINLAQPMLSRGEVLCIWTAEMQDPDIFYPPPTGGAPTPPTSFPDLEGSARPYIDMQVP